MGYKLCNFCENRARVAGRLYSTFWSNLSKNFSLWGLHPCRCTDGGEIRHAGGDQSATCRPCGAKNLKIGLWVNEIPAACAARNAAGNKHCT